MVNFLSSSSESDTEVPAIPVTRIEVTAPVTQEPTNNLLVYYGARLTFAYYLMIFCFYDYDRSDLVKHFPLDFLVIAVLTLLCWFAWGPRKMQKFEVEGEIMR